MTQSLTEFLDYYLDEAPKGERAVLITGPWGSGKTHFAKTYFDARVRRQADPLSRRHLYASLYGVTSAADIADQVFAAAHPLLHAWPVRMLAGAAQRAGNVVTKGQLFKPNDGSALRKTLLNLDGTVLIFDDLERAAMPVDQVLGFINEYVEHHKVKCLILANETEIDDDNHRYSRRREKVVGWTLAINSDAGTVLGHFAEMLRSPQAKAAVHRNMSGLVTVFETAGGGNFRTAKDVLDAFDRLILHADPRLGESEAALDQLAPFTLATGLELRSGTLSQNDLASIPVNQVRSVDEMKRRHPAVNWSNPVVPADAWGRMLMQGQFEKGSIDDRICVHHLVVGTASTPFWRRLWLWYEARSAAELAAASEGVLADLAAHRITRAGEILHVGSCALDLAAKGFKMFGPDPIRPLLTAYAQRLLEAGTLDTDLEIFEGFQTGAYDGLGFSSKDDPEFIGFFEDLHTLVSEAFAREVCKMVPGLMADLRAGHWHLLTKAELDQGGVGEVAILHHLDVEDFADLVLADGAIDNTLLIAVSMRYRSHVADGQPFEIERDWLLALRSVLLARTAIQAPPFGAFNTNQITDRFDRIMNSFGAKGAAPD